MRIFSLKQNIFLLNEKLIPVFCAILRIRPCWTEVIIDILSIFFMSHICYCIPNCRPTLEMNHYSISYNDFPTHFSEKSLIFLRKRQSSNKKENDLFTINNFYNMEIGSLMFNY